MLWPIPSTKSNRNAIGWLYFDGQKCRPRKVMGRAYLPVIFELVGWNSEWTYYIKGECMDNGQDSFLLFNLNDAEGVIKPPPSNVAATLRVDPQTESIPAIKAMPQEWLDSFGAGYYNPSAITPDDSIPGGWNVQATGTPIPRNDPFDATSEADLKIGIASLIARITERSADYDRTN